MSNTTDRLYAISHTGPVSVVEVFSISYQFISQSPAAQLTHLTTIQSHLFPRYGINDVVEVSHQCPRCTRNYTVAH